MNRPHNSLFCDVHSIELQEWQEEIQLMGVRASSFVVCRKEAVGNGNTGWTLLPTSKSHFDVSDFEKKKFASMWEWGQQRLCNYPTVKASVSFKLSDVQRQGSENVELYNDENSRGDATVMVTAIIPRTSEIADHPHGFLRVWDGTGVPLSDPLFNFNPQALESVADGDPPVQAVVRLADLVKKLGRLGPNKKPLLEPCAVTGRVVNVAVWEASHWELVKDVIRIGTFIRLRNVQDNKMPESNLRCVMVHSKSYMTPLPEMTFEVVRLIEAHNTRLERKDELNPSSGILPAPEEEEEEDAAHAASESPERRLVSPRKRRASPMRRSPKRRKQSQGASGDFGSMLDSDLPIKFTGVVNIVGTVPEFPSLAKGGMANIINANHSFAVKLEDNELNQIDAVVNPRSEVALAVLGGEAPAGGRVEFATAFLKAAIKKRWRWIAEIRSVLMDGQKYFTLENIEKCQGNK